MFGEKKVVSVIIPVHNKEEDITRCLKSVINQTYKNLEIIIVDDGSTDDSMKKVKKINDDRIRIFINNKNKGVSYSRNRGIEESTGDYLAFLDADDYYEPDFVERMLNLKAQKNSDVVFCEHYVLKTTLKPIKFELYKKEITAERAIELYLKRKIRPTTNSWLIKSNIVKEDKIRFDTSLAWGEDILFFLTVLSKVEKVNFIPRPLTTYVQEGQESLSTKQRYFDKIKQDVEWLSKAKEILKDQKNFLQIIDIIEGYRIPASYVYNTLDYVKETSNYKLYNGDLEDIKKYLYSKPLKCSNGLRSCKLYVAYYKLMYYLREIV